MKRIADEQHIENLGVDIGGATTDIFSVFQGVFNRTVSANLGMSYSISNVFAESGIANIMRWVPFKMEEIELANRVKNKMIRPTTIPQSAQELVLEQAIAREALRLALEQHKAFATELKGVQKQRTIGDAFDQKVGGQTLVNMMTLNLMVGSGGVLSHAPRMNQTAMMMIDAFQPEGITRVGKDSIFMMPHLGVLAQVHSKAALEVFEKDCLIYLGTCIAPSGLTKEDKEVMEYEINLPNGKVEGGVLKFGQVKLIPLGTGETAIFKGKPAKGFDLGKGKGVNVEQEIWGGTVGIMLDGRGRPLELPKDDSHRVKKLIEWLTAWEVYSKDILKSLG